MTMLNRLKYRYLLKLTRLFPSLFPDAWYLKAYYFFEMGRELNLDTPTLYSEKLQWLKIHNRKPEYETMVDKVKVKEYVASLIGEKYVIPTLGVYNNFDEIEFDKLPNEFVLKCNHDSGNVIVCKNKQKLDIQHARKVLTDALNTDFYLRGREWPYKNVKRKIMAEYFLSTPNEPFYNHLGMTDFKFSCFNGRVNDVMVCLERESGDTKFYFFDKDWNLLRYNIRGKNAPEGFTIPKPENFEKMVEIAEILSKNIPYLRVDLYN
ncbi:MAG: glycosyl transferase, partial [Muribaculaceae bacterium]|nr:glycosyl transferase [Muribaculaceae bacterium]